MEFFVRYMFQRDIYYFSPISGNTPKKFKILTGIEGETDLGSGYLSYNLGLSAERLVFFLEIIHTYLSTHLCYHLL